MKSSTSDTTSQTGFHRVALFCSMHDLARLQMEAVDRNCTRHIAYSHTAQPQEFAVQHGLTCGVAAVQRVAAQEGWGRQLVMRAMVTVVEGHGVLVVMCGGGSSKGCSRHPHISSWWCTWPTVEVVRRARCRLHQFLLQAKHCGCQRPCAALGRSSPVPLKYERSKNC